MNKDGWQESFMRQSHVIEIDGIFLGAAVRLEDGFRFVAVDARVSALDGRVLATLEQARAAARHAFRAAPRTAVKTATQPALATIDVRVHSSALTLAR